MGDKREEKFSFTYNSYKGDVRCDIESTKPKEPAHLSLKVSYDDRYPILFAYEYGNGLVRVDESANKKRNTNILGSFLRIKHDDYNEYINFFNENGFLYELDLDRFIKIEISDIIKIAKRLQALVDLIGSIKEHPSKRELMVLFENSYSIAMDSGWELELSNKTKKKSPNHHIKEIIEDSNICLDNGQLTREEIDKGIITVKDTIYNSFELKSKDYRSIQGGESQTPGWQDLNFMNIAYLYVNKANVAQEMRGAIDCIFHFLYEIGIPKNTAVSEEVSYYNEPDYLKIDDKLGKSIISFAKYVIKTEINEMIKDIKPVYNEETMRPDWKIDSLLSAMYFSIFYLDSKMEMYKRCSYCGSLFLVKRSSSTKIYCSSYCRNNAQQAKHRLKNKQVK